MAAVERPGTLHADGTLSLDAKPDLPPGAVRVKLGAATPAPVGRLVALLQSLPPTDPAVSAAHLADVEGGRQEDEDAALDREAMQLENDHARRAGREAAR